MLNTKQQEQYRSSLKNPSFHGLKEIQKTDEAIANHKQQTSDSDTPPEDEPKKPKIVSRLDELSNKYPIIAKTLKYNDRWFNIKNKKRQYSNYSDKSYSEHPKEVLSAMLEDNRVKEGDKYFLEKCLSIILHDTVEDIPELTTNRVIDDLNLRDHDLNIEKIIRIINEVTNDHQKMTEIEENLKNQVPTPSRTANINIKTPYLTTKMIDMKEKFSRWIKLYDRANNTCDFSNDKAPITWILRYGDHTEDWFQRILKSNENKQFLSDDHINFINEIRKQMILDIHTKIDKISAMQIEIEKQQKNSQYQPDTKKFLTMTEKDSKKWYSDLSPDDKLIADQNSLTKKKNWLEASKQKWMIDMKAKLHTLTEKIENSFPTI